MNVLKYLWVLASAFLLEIQQSVAKRDKALYCSICRALVDEVDARIGDVDPNKKIESGSYRVDPHGNQKLVKIDYARSDLHLTEIFETVCDSFEDYALTQSPNGQHNKLGVTRVKDRKTGKELDTKNVGYNVNLRSTFKNYCHSMIEDFEDDMLRLFKQENLKSVEAELCSRLAEACDSVDLKRPLPRLDPKQDHRDNSLHQLEPEEELEEESEEIESDEGVDENIVAKSDKKKKKSEKDKEEL